MAVPVPTVTSIAPGTSRLGRTASGCSRTGTNSGIAMSRATPIGTLMANTHRQPASDVSTPPSTTPRAEPALASADHTPSALPRLGPVYSVMTVASAAGDISAAPTPCSARPTSRTAAPPESAHTIDDAMNSDKPSRVTRRAPTRSAIRPPRSISPPKNTVYAVITQGSAPCCRCRDAPISGNATFTTVTSRTSISCAEARRAKAADRRDRGWLGCHARGTAHG